MAANRLLTVPLITLAPGAQRLLIGPGVLALIVTRGLIAARLHVEDEIGTTVIGEGELLCPSDSAHGRGSLRERREIVALGRTQLVALDRRFWIGAARWPALGDAFLECLEERIHLGTVSVALHQRHRVDERVWLTLWQLGDRHGKVNPNGVRINLPRFTHQLLAELVAARRPSVTCAVGRLISLGLVECDRSGQWLLTASVSEGLEALRRACTVEDHHDGRARVTAIASAG